MLNEFKRMHYYNRIYVYKKINDPCNKIRYVINENLQLRAITIDTPTVIIQLQQSLGPLIENRSDDLHHSHTHTLTHGETLIRTKHAI